MSKRSTIPKRLADFVAFPAVVSIICIILSQVISVVRTKVGTTSVLIALGCVLVAYVVTLIVVAIQYRPLCIGLLEEINRRLLGVVDPHGLGLVDNDGLVAIEQKAEDDEIWIVTDDLLEDVPGSAYFNVVHENLAKGIRYVYFCPKSARTGGRVAQIMTGHGQYADRLTFSYLPDNFFFLSSRLDFCIYNPLNKKGQRRGYMGLPVTTDRHLHCPVEIDLLDALVGKLSEYRNAQRGETS